jgi:hypothetical protein
MAAVQKEKGIYTSTKGKLVSCFLSPHASVFQQSHTWLLVINVATAALIITIDQRDLQGAP